MADIVCLGEALIDLVPTVTGVGLAAAETFVKAAGGAPANVAAGLARLGVASGFMGMVGDDGFGHFLADTLAANGVALPGLRFTSAAPTALAAVSLRADGDREFVFYGNPAAHMLFAPEDVDEAVVRRAKILHFGSISLVGGPVRAATLHAIELAHKHGVRVSYDPNLRLSLWPDAEAARAGMRLGLSHADIVKIGEEEVEFLTSSCDTIEGARALWHPKLQLMAVDAGHARKPLAQCRNAGRRTGLQGCRDRHDGRGRCLHGRPSRRPRLSPRIDERSRDARPRDPFRQCHRRADDDETRRYPVAPRSRDGRAFLGRTRSASERCRCPYLD